jgi:hypothetical protein
MGDRSTDARGRTKPPDRPAPVHVRMLLTRAGFGAAPADVALVRLLVTLVSGPSRWVTAGI